MDSLKTESKEDVKEKKTKDEDMPKKGKLTDDQEESSKMRIIQNDTFLWWILFSLLTVISVITRLYKIEVPSMICWDETHFGKMGSYYINRTFFHDVHPPLGKMLIGMAGVLTGYEGNFTFPKPGVSYEENNIPYVGMRIFCGLLGSAIAPMAYVGVWELTSSLLAAFLTGFLVICDVGFVTLTHFILLDSIMLFFISLATMSAIKCFSRNQRQYSKEWWFWLSLTGVGLAGSIGVKFVGLFVVLLVGFTTIAELWDLFGTMSISLFEFVKHFVARALCLILLPAVLYMVFFMVHFKLLNMSGPGDGFYSSWFQSTLQGNPLHNASMPEDVMYGSVITIKQFRTAGAYLHSHWHLYPEGVGARQQQVTSYSHKDINNHFIVKRINEDPEIFGTPEPLQNGDVIRLEHKETRRNLHSHAMPAPVTKNHHQVTCYGSNGTGDANDLFRVEIERGTTGEPVKALSTVFRLIHHNLGCAIYSHNKQLPKWGWEQMEVTCNPHHWDPDNRWTVELVKDDRLKNATFESLRPGFLSKFMESHKVMLQSNSGLKPKEDEQTSRPWMWPIDYRGQPFCGPKPRIILLGNPVLWWGNCVMIVYYLLLCVYHSVRVKRGYQEKKFITALRDNAVCSGTWLFLGWFLHYAPFWAMSRVLYFHHYFPAAIFSHMLTGVLLNYMISSMSQLFRPSIERKLYYTLSAFVTSAILYSFYLFQPLSYGIDGPNSQDANGVMYGLKWLRTWDF